MGRVVRLVIGLWRKSPSGVWTFEETPNSQGEAVILHNTQSFDGLVEMICITLNLGILTPVALTYQLPEWMILPDGPTTPPITLLTDKDVELMASVMDYMADAVLYVTSGPELVAKYQFLCRTPFCIDDKTYLEAGITEEQHRQDIVDLVGGHPIVCSKHVLEIMFNEPQLLLVFRVALEIEMVYGLDNDAADTDDHLTGDDSMSLEGVVPLSPNSLNNSEPNHEVLYGEPMTIEELHNTFPHYEAAAMVHEAARLGVQPLNLWEEEPDEENYLDGMAEQGRSYEVYVASSTHPAEDVIGLPLSQNRRVCAPQPPTIIVIDDDSEGSYTGSSEGFNVTENMTALPPPVPEVSDSMVEGNKGQAGLTGCESSAEITTTNNVTNGEMQTAWNPTTDAADREPFLELTLGVGVGNSRADPEPRSETQDSSSETEDGSGGFGPLF
ncbi:unnamed protein product [Brassica rapa subsp. narinosa]